MKTRITGRVLLVGASALMFASVAMADTIYVDQDATGNDDGTSWTDAYRDFQDGLGDCTSGDDIWVAEGTYRPASYYGFWLINGCRIYGGFAGTETQESQRDPWTHETVLSGDRNADDPTVTDNAYHVVFAGSTTGSTTVLDGFTITAGYAVGGTYFDQVGGGMLVAGSPTLAQLLFMDNYASTNGGAMNIGNESQAWIDRSIFHHNATSGHGGALFITSDSVPVFSNSLFHSNATENGAGGAGYVVSCDPEFINCTFSDNRAGTGGGIYLSGAADPIITNSILYYNDDGGQDDESANLYIGGSSSPVVTYSDWEGHGAVGTGNIDADPAFIEEGTYEFKADTPCFDTGTNAAVFTDLDLRNKDRIVFEAVDMGAYEVQEQ